MKAKQRPHRPPRRRVVPALLLALVALPVLCGCHKGSDEDGKKMMESFKGGAETADEKAGDQKAISDAAAYRKAHPELFPPFHK